MLNPKFSGEVLQASEEAKQAKAEQTSQQTQAASRESQTGKRVLLFILLVLGGAIFLEVSQTNQKASEPVPPALESLPREQQVELRAKAREVVRLHELHKALEGTTSDAN